MEQNEKKKNSIYFISKVDLKKVGNEKVRKRTNAVKKAKNNYFF